jgi:hypothetical protein
MSKVIYDIIDAAQHYNTAPDILAKLANNKYYYIRATVSENPNTPYVILTQ